MDENTKQPISFEDLLELVQQLRQCIDEEYPTRSEVVDIIGNLRTKIQEALDQLGEGIIELSRINAKQMEYLGNSTGFILFVLAMEHIITEDEMTVLQKVDFDPTELLVKYIARKTEGELDESTLRETMFAAREEAKQKIEEEENGDSDPTVVLTDTTTYKE